MVEWNGRIYERAVYEFDQQAKEVNEYCENLPETKKRHQRELLEVPTAPSPLPIIAFQFFDTLAIHHRQCAATISENIARHGIAVVPVQNAKK